MSNLVDLNRKGGRLFPRIAANSKAIEGIVAKSYGAQMKSTATNVPVTQGQSMKFRMAPGKQWVDPQSLYVVMNVTALGADVTYPQSANSILNRCVSYIDGVLHEDIQNAHMYIAQKNCYNFYPFDPSHTPLSITEKYASFSTDASSNPIGHAGTATVCASGATVDIVLSLDNLLGFKKLHHLFPAGLLPYELELFFNAPLAGNLTINRAYLACDLFTLDNDLFDEINKAILSGMYSMRIESARGMTATTVSATTEQQDIIMSHSAISTKRLYFALSSAGNLLKFDRALNAHQAKFQLTTNGSLNIPQNPAGQNEVIQRGLQCNKKYRDSQPYSSWLDSRMIGNNKHDNVYLINMDVVPHWQTHETLNSGVDTRGTSSSFVLSGSFTAGGGQGSCYAFFEDIVDLIVTNGAPNVIR